MGFTAQELADDPLPTVNDKNRKVPTALALDSDGRTIRQSLRMPSFQFALH
jgi:hypothetical protein